MGILEEVNASYEKLSPVQKRIADFIFKYPDQVCFYSLKELSETLGVTEVTILRFTKKIGAQSFVEMKNRLREHLQTRLVHGDGLNRIADYVGGIRFGDHDKEEMFQEFVANEKNVIAKTFEQVSSPQWRSSGSPGRSMWWEASWQLGSVPTRREDS